MAARIPAQELGHDGESPHPCGWRIAGKNSPQSAKNPEVGLLPGHTRRTISTGYVDWGTHENGTLIAAES